MEENLKNINIQWDNRGVLTVTLNRPQVHNAFNDEMIGEMTKLFVDWGKRTDLRCVVLASEGKSFCAGADLHWMKKMKDYQYEDNYRDSLELSRLFSTIDNLDVPVIGRIQGSALGGGVGLVSVCDFAIAVESAKFGLTEVRLGLLPAVISPFVVGKIGVGHARDTFLSGERFLADKAYHIGLVQKVVDNEVALDEAVAAQIQEYLAVAPKALKECKQLLRRYRLHNEDWEKLTCETISRVRIGDEAQEGMAALLEKRRPKWQVSEK